MSKQSWNDSPGQGGECGESVRIHRYTMSKQSGSQWPVPAARLGSDVRKCEPVQGKRGGVSVPGRGLHSSTFQLILSALYGIGGVRKGLCSPC
jgi:hypothetical protein